MSGNAALVRGIADIALGFQIHNGRRTVSGITGLANDVGSTDGERAPTSAVASR